jgi:hypothetical protein
VIDSDIAEEIAEQRALMETRRDSWFGFAADSKIEGGEPEE